MRSVALARYKSIHLLLILSIITSFFVIPAPAKAGLLGSILYTLRPVLKYAGRIGGAVVGASMCSAFVPPLGLLVGGIAGWIVGGIITDFGTSSLSNLAFLGGGVLGAMALGPGVLGIIGGFLLGGILGKIAYGIIKSVDNDLTGGVIFDKSRSPSGAVSFSTAQPSGAVEIPVSRAVEPNNAATSGLSLNEKIQQAEADYRKAYQNYCDIMKSGADAKAVKAAKEAYEKAYSEYLKLKGN